MEESWEYGPGAGAWHLGLKNTRFLAPIELESRREPTITSPPDDSSANH